MSQKMTDSLIQLLLSKYKKITIVGVSSKPSRASYGVSLYLQRHGYQIDGVNPSETLIHGQPVYPALAQVPHPLEIVDVFRNSDAIPDLVEELIPLKPKVLWLQEGVVHPAAEQRARDAGIEVISDRCILKEHQRLSGA